jgi:hypothetical protein
LRGRCRSRGGDDLGIRTGPHRYEASIRRDIDDLRSGAEGQPIAPFTSADHAARFRSEVERRWPAERCEAIAEMSRNFTTLKDMRELVRLIAS